jgi:hypothetical protein
MLNCAGLGLATDLPWLLSISVSEMKSFLEAAPSATDTGATDTGATELNDSEE